MQPDRSFASLEHPDAAFGRVGVLLVNLGTPEGTDYWSMRRYLGEFLSDKRVVEVPRIAWLPLLHGIILTFRPRRSGRAYEKIWNKTDDESPLRTHTRAQADGLRQLLGPEVIVDWAMRYGQPSIDNQLKDMKAAGCDRILLVPLYPQYSASTSASVVDKMADSLKAMRWQPAMRTLAPYYRDTDYIDAVARSIFDQVNALDFEPDVVIASYHGVPQAYLEKGDPYHCQCLVTTRLLRDKIGWSDDKLITAFQSRFGPAKWLQPYFDETLKELAGSGVKKVAVVMPGFASDCLETLEEIAIGGKEIFLEAGGTDFAALSCLNDSDIGLSMLEKLVRRDLGGWV